MKQMLSQQLKRGDHCSEITSPRVQYFVWKDKSCIIQQYHMQSIQPKNSAAKVERWLNNQCVLPTICAAVQQVHEGVNMADQLRKHYCCRRRPRKFWLPLFYFMPDISVVNSYILHRNTPHTTKLSIKEFILHLAAKLMSKESTMNALLIPCQLCHYSLVSGKYISLAEKRLFACKFICIEYTSL